MSKSSSESLARPLDNEAGGASVEKNAERQQSASSDHAGEVAAVDLGSNSFHMLVAEPVDREFRVLDRLKEPVRLAQGLDKRRQLSEEARERGLACLERFGQRLRGIEASRVRVVGTKTLRRMRRSAAFLADAKAAVGHDIEIVSGVEEARLIYSGVSWGLGLENPRRLVVDIGGGSTELIIGDGMSPVLMESVSLGCVAQTIRWFPKGKFDKKSLRDALVAAKMDLRFLVRNYREQGWDVAIGASGTINTVARVCAEQGWCTHGISGEALNKLMKSIIKIGSIDKLDFPGLKEDRRPVFVAGVVILSAIFESLNIQRMETSNNALREGVVLDLLGRLDDRDARMDSVAAIAHRYNVDGRHAQSVQTAVLKMLQSLRSSLDKRSSQGWVLDKAIDVRMLLWAAQLHEIGLAIGHASYHHHGEYLILHSDLHGFSRNDQQVLATLVRYHRGKLDAEAFKKLPLEWQSRAIHLVVLLRLAFLLNRGRDYESPLRPTLRICVDELILSLSEQELAENPLTQADLKRESKRLRNLDVNLTLELLDKAEPGSKA